VVKRLVKLPRISESGKNCFGDGRKRNVWLEPTAFPVYANSPVSRRIVSMTSLDGIKFAKTERAPVERRNLSHY
jgi:hypothetical protein